MKLLPCNSSVRFSVCQFEGFFGGVCVGGRGGLCGTGAGTGAVTQHHAPKV